MQRSIFAKQKLRALAHTIDADVHIDTHRHTQTYTDIYTHTHCTDIDTDIHIDIHTDIHTIGLCWQKWLPSVTSNIPSRLQLRNSELGELPGGLGQRAPVAPVLEPQQQGGPAELPEKNGCRAGSGRLTPAPPGRPPSQPSLPPCTHFQQHHHHHHHHQQQNQASTTCIIVFGVDDGRVDDRVLCLLFDFVVVLVLGHAD